MAVPENVYPRIQWHIGHELGVMFGFMGAMVIVTIIFSVFWIGKNKRQASLEKARQEVLRQAGWGLDGWKNERGEFGGKNGRGVQGVGEERIEELLVAPRSQENNRLSEKESLADVK